SYTAGFNGNLSETTLTDGSNSTVIYTAAYSDANDPYAPGSVTDGDSVRTQFTHDVYGNVLTRTTNRGTVTTYTWSYTNFALGELTKLQEGSNLGSSAKQPTTFTYYEPSGLTNTVTYPLPGTSGGTQTAQLSCVWSSLGNVTQITTPGNNAATSITTTFSYTTDGSYGQAEALGEPIAITNNLGKTSHLRYDARSNCVSSTDALGNETDWSFNLADQTTQVTYPATGQTGTGRAYTANTYLYTGGPLTTVTSFDESGTQVRQVGLSYGPEGEFLSRTGSAEPVTVAWDGAYRLQALQDGNAHSTQWQRNTAGDVSQITFPGGDSIQYTSYDNAGKPLVRVDGRGVTTDYTWADPDGFLSKIHYPASSSLDVT
ncbi:MAG: hypothetical protein ACREQ5_32815, partial [Candidatus Dormibacteria bacterium]